MDETPTRRVRPLAVVLGLVVAGLAVMWGYALFFAPDDLANRLDDRAWPAEAEAICARWSQAVDALPPASDFSDIEPRSEAIRQRAVVGDQATTLLTSMVAELEAVPAPAGAQDARLVSDWLADYRTYLANRDAHVAQWRAGEDAMFAVQAVNGVPITLRMDELARQNDMPSCKVPGDL